MSIFEDPFDFNHDGTVDGGEMAMAYEFFLKDSSNHNDGWSDEEEENFLDDMEMMDEMDEEW